MSVCRVGLAAVILSCLLTEAVCLHPPALSIAAGSPRALPAAEPPQLACRLPRDRGRRCSRGPVLRWYLDEEQGDCLSFWFAGCAGNANNFVSESDCRDVCVTASGSAVCLLPAGRGPCTDSRLLWTFDAESQQCVTFVYGGCYGTANRFFTLRQCEQACLVTSDGDGVEGNEDGVGTEPECLQRAGASGRCGAELVRYTYLAAADVCTPFLFGGCAGNDNNFHTLEECRERCETLADSGTNNSTEETTGQEQNQTETDQGTSESSRVDLCFLPRDSGSCLSYAPMFYYNVRTASCHQFIYRGCGGNANRFHTRSECQQRCVTAAVADTGRDTGVGQQNGTVPDSDEVHIESNETMTGSGVTQLSVTADGSSTVTPGVDVIGNSVDATSSDVRTGVRPTAAPVTPVNKTLSRDPGRAAASRRRRPGARPGPGGRLRGPRGPRGRRACLLRPRPGPCHHYLPQFYYYNADLAGCFTFIYGGCGGNRNRFATKEACERRCKGVRRRIPAERRAQTGGPSAVEPVASAEPL